MRQWIQNHPREFRIAVLFGIFNLILPLILVNWFFGRATHVRYPILRFSLPRDEANPWLVFLVFATLLFEISLVQIKVFRIDRWELATCYLPCAMAFVFVVFNGLLPCRLFGWAAQDIADRGLGIYSDPPNPSNPVRPYFRLLLSFVLVVLIFSTQIAAVRTYLSRR